MLFDPLLTLYAVPLLVVWMVYLSRRRKFEMGSRAKLQAAAESGLLEPASLHPEIDPAQCTGCGACVRACPEGDILGLIDGRAVLVEPSECIGHGACRSACPSNAISLVFGTAKRGVDIPHVRDDFETNVPGIFIAGELGGMGLVRNAIEQGRQAVDSVRKLDGLGDPRRYDVVIIGSGPAGFSASLAAMQHGLRYATIEQDSFGGTVAHFPRGKLVMTAPATLPLIGKVKFREISKEKLLEFWGRAARDTGLQIRYGERVESVAATGGGFEVKTTRAAYPTRSVVLAIGRRGTPRKLDIPGEELPKVVYRLVDPVQYRGQNVLVVGGGDSALEAAVSIAEEPGATVTLSHRSESFSRAKMKNRERVAAAQHAGRLNVLMASKVDRITERTVQLSYGDKQITIKNEAVIVCVGGILPTPFLESIGIEVQTKYGAA